MGMGVCGRQRSGSKIMYAWGRNAPPLKLPEGLSINVKLQHNHKLTMIYKSLSDWPVMASIFLCLYRSPVDKKLTYLKFVFSSDVAFHIGGTTKVKYLVLQVHYGHVDKFLRECW